MNVQELAGEWRRLMAPRTGDVRTELVEEAAEYLGIPVSEAWQRHKDAGERFRQEWHEKVGDSSDPDVLTTFYNSTETELFELIEWHATDPMHYRTLAVRDLALARPGRSYLDYGSGIGSDAVVFADAGFEVTLADISDILLGFAAFRCRRRGATPRIVDLKTSGLPQDAFDVVVCFDVLEHIPKPLPVVRRIARALRTGGIVAIHAPFGEDPVHPMHVAHRDVVTPRMRSMGFQWVDLRFPPEIRAPFVFRKTPLSWIDRLGYFVYDGYLHNTAAARIAHAYRRLAARWRTPERARA
jgi:2-polyprenyl-3-methyl-5-hydroxy-6-metoxy-1,4-benzoquinol methylase